MFTQPASALNPQRLRIFPSPTLIYSVYKFEYKEKEKQSNRLLMVIKFGNTTDCVCFTPPVELKKSRKNFSNQKRK